MDEVRTLHAIDGEAKTVAELELEAFEELYDVASRHASTLKAARSVWERFFRAVENQAGGAVEDRTDDRSWEERVGGR